jgi:hypothetical protein
LQRGSYSLPLPSRRRSSSPEGGRPSVTGLVVAWKGWYYKTKSDQIDDNKVQGSSYTVEGKLQKEKNGF